MGSPQNYSNDTLSRISRASKDQVLQIIFSEWEYYNPENRTWSLRLYLTAGKKMLEYGQAFIGYDILTEGLKYYPNNVILLQQQALALARLGKTGKAQEILLRLYKKGNRHPDTIGILARTYKDLWKKSTDNKQGFLRLSRDKYLEGFNKNKDDEYTGINAASLSLFLGEHNKARDIASRVGEICRRKRPRDESNRYWVQVSLALANMILGDYKRAAECYKKAFEKASGMHANLATTIQQDRLVLNYLKSRGLYPDKPHDTLEKILDPGNIVFCVGHMMDHPDREYPRFPPALEPEVRLRIRKTLNELNATIGYSSAACGTDILFAEEMLLRRADLHIHLPFRREDFIKTSVQFAGEGWGERFRKILERASSVIEPVGESYLGDDCLFGFGNEVTIGKVSLHADTLGITPNLLAVWDGKSGDGRFGTSDVVKFWKKHFGSNLNIINITELYPTGSYSITDRKSKMYRRPKVKRNVTCTSNLRGLSRKIMPMLIADVVRFSKILEEQIPYFMHKFLGEIKSLTESKQFAPSFKNTWGDTLFFIFKNVSDAARFALELRDLVLCTDWRKKGLPDETNIRIALHAGPVYSGVNPISGKRDYYGSHVNRTARIEPVTLPGSVYVSEPFAALLRAKGVSNVVCEYIGQQTLAKEYGVYPIYLLRRVNEVE